MSSSMAVALAGFSFMLTVIWGPPLLRVLRYFKVGKADPCRRTGAAFYQTGHPDHGWGDDRDTGIADYGIAECQHFVWDHHSGAFGNFTHGYHGCFHSVGRGGRLGQVCVANARAKGLSARTKFAHPDGFCDCHRLALKYFLKTPECSSPACLAIELGIWYIPIAVLASCRSRMRST